MYHSEPPESKGRKFLRGLILILTMCVLFIPGLLGLNFLSGKEKKRKNPMYDE